jgi:lysophospholipase L1-like esterase
MVSTGNPHFRVAALALAIAGCGDATAGALDAAAAGIVVDVRPRTAQTLPSGSVSFSATVTGTVNTQVTWSVQETNGGTVDGGGGYTAPATVGSFHVVATSAADGTKTSVATVTVTTAPVIAVSINPPSASTTTGSQVQFAAQVTGTTGGQSTAVGWSVQEAGGGSIDGNGLYTAPATPGTYHVVATSVADASKTDSAPVAVNLPPAGVGAVAMTLLSRTVPATASAGTASQGQDDSYGGPLWGLTSAQVGNNGWLAYDLSGVPANQRTTVLVALYFGLGNGQQQINIHWQGGNGVVDNIPSAYVVEAATSSGGPWTVLATVGNNCQTYKAHLVDMTGYTWIRFRATGSANGAPYVNMDVYSAPNGVTDGFVFYGDSITSNLFTGDGLPGYPPEWFSKGIRASRPTFFPPIVGGGIPFMTSGDGKDLIVAGTGGFATGLDAPLRATYSAPRYACLVFGANDAPAQNLVDGFRANYASIINALRAQGQVVVLASPTWATDSGRQAGLVQIRASIGFHLPGWTAGTFASGTYVWNGTRAYLCTTGGNSVTGPTGTGSSIADGGSARWKYVPSLREDYAADPGVIGGPDLYTVFQNHPEWFGDGLHPNGTGEPKWRAAFVSWALANIYQ